MSQPTTPTADKPLTSALSNQDLLQLNTKRKKGVTFVVPIVFGSRATPIPKDDPTFRKENTHRWEVFLESPLWSDLTWVIEKVRFKLHDSFAIPIRDITKPPYKVEESGWGEFDISIKIYFVRATEKPVTLEHRLKLFEEDKEKDTPGVQVLSEHYDELIFNDPHEYLHNLYLKHKPESETITQGRFTHDSEKKELEQLAGTLSAVAKKIAIYSTRLSSLTEKAKSLREEKAPSQSGSATTHSKKKSSHLLVPEVDETDISDVTEEEKEDEEFRPKKKKDDRKKGRTK